MRALVAPIAPYNVLSGGERCRWEVLAEVARRGVSVYVNEDAKPTGEWPFMPLPEAELREVLADGGVCLYTDIVPGNPLAAERVVRWVMAPPGKVRNREGTCWLPGQVEHEQVYLFHRMYGRHMPEGMRDAPVLYWLPTDYDLFNLDGLPPKQGGCVYQRKWVDPVPPGAALLPRLHLPLSRAQLAAEFKRHEWVLVLDYNTFAMWEAGLCGCYGRLPPNSVFSREDYESTPLGLVGVAMSGADVERARAEVAPREDGHNGVWDRYQYAQQFAQWTVDEFVTQLQEGW